MDEQKYREIFGALSAVIMQSTTPDDILNVPVCFYCGSESIMDESNQWISNHTEICPIEILRINFKIIRNALLFQIDKEI